MHAGYRLPRSLHDGIAPRAAPPTASSVCGCRPQLPGTLLGNTSLSDKSLRGTSLALLAGVLLGAVACDLNFDYAGTAVAGLTPVQQRRFCDDAALQMARTYVGSLKALCGLSALDPATCVENFDTCAADYDPDMMTDRSKGVVAGNERCLELFEEGAFASCQIDAGLYVACATETAAHLAALDSEEVCTAPPPDAEDTVDADENDTNDTNDATDAGPTAPPDDAGLPPANEHTPSCAEMERLCADNPFTPTTIREAADAYEGEGSGDPGMADASAEGSDG